MDVLLKTTKMKRLPYGTMTTNVTGAMLYQNVVCVIVLLGIIQVAQACEEPEHCENNANFCAIREKYRETCPCTCAADLNLIKCCENQKFEQPECRQLCTYAPQLERNFKTLSIKCFNDFFKIQYCSSNGHSNSTECCLKNGVTKDEPGKPGAAYLGCSVFCEVRLPKCSQTFEYMHCARGKQLQIGVKCARDNFDIPRWEANSDVTCGS